MSVSHPASGPHDHEDVPAGMWPVLMIAAALAVAAAVAVGLAIRAHAPVANKGSGVAVVQTRAVPAFTGVDLAGANDVVIRVGRPRSVVVRGDDNLVARIATRVNEGILEIANRGSVKTVAPTSVTVTAPALTSAVLSGTGAVTVLGVRAPAFVVRVPGAGVVRVSGRTQRLDASIQGAGDALLDGLVARDAVAVIEGSGRIRVHATRALRATVDGVGAIDYAGHPRRVTRSVTGTGTIAPL